jgi:hypothetical protein
MTHWMNERGALLAFRKLYKKDMKLGFKGLKFLCEFCCFPCQEKVINKYIKEARKEGMLYKYVTDLKTKENYFIVLFKNTEQSIKDEFYQTNQC